MFSMAYFGSCRLPSRLEMRGEQHGTNYLSSLDPNARCLRTLLLIGVLGLMLAAGYWVYEISEREDRLRALPSQSSR